jgi:hypothetical protein
MPATDFESAVRTGISWHDEVLADISRPLDRALTGPRAASYAAEWDEHVAGRRLDVDRNLDDRHVLTGVLDGT